MGAFDALKRLFVSDRVAKRDSGGDNLLDRFKAHVLGEGLESNALAPDDSALNEFAKAGALSPPLPFEQLAILLTTSNALRQNIDAYATNIDGFGWEPVPVIDLFGQNPKKAVREFLASRVEGDVTDDMVEAKAREWRAEAIRERDKLTHFFEFLNPKETFTEIRKKLRTDYELLGNGAWEIVRQRDTEPAMVNHVPFVTMRLMPLDEQPITVKVPAKVDPITIEPVEVRCRFRRYVQIQENLTVFFKEWGDPRLYSSASGQHYDSVEEMEKAEGKGVKPATEILHFQLYGPNQAYGIARWLGVLPEVVGSRLAAEVNVLYFENKSVPPMAILVSGGRVAASSIERIKSFIENDIKGTGNFWRVLVLEAEPAGEGKGKNAGRAQIKLVPLTDAQQQDALFQRYDQRNIDKVGATFRVPGMLRGDIKELNRATAEVAKALAEEQVFQPERDVFDAIMNRRILPWLGIRFWTFRTKAPQTRDPSRVSNILTQLVSNGIITPGEGRQLAAQVLGHELPSRDDAWLDQPLRLSLAEMRTTGDVGSEGDPGPEEKGDLSIASLVEDGGALVPGQGTNGEADGLTEDERRRRERMRQLAPLIEDVAMIRAGVQARELKEDVVRVPADEWRRWFEDGSDDADADTEGR